MLNKYEIVLTKVAYKYYAGNKAVLLVVLVLSHYLLLAFLVGLLGILINKHDPFLHDMKPDWFLEVYLFDNTELNSNDSTVSAMKLIYQ